MFLGLCWSAHSVSCARCTRRNCSRCGDDETFRCKNPFSRLPPRRIPALSAYQALPK